MASLRQTASLYFKCSQLHFICLSKWGLPLHLLPCHHQGFFASTPLCLTQINPNFCGNIAVIPCLRLDTLIFNLFPKSPCPLMVSQLSCYESHWHSHSPSYNWSTNSADLESASGILIFRNQPLTSNVCSQNRHHFGWNSGVAGRHYKHHNRNHNHNRNLQTSKVPIESQTEGTSLFTRAAYK